MIIFETESIRVSFITARLLRTESGNFTDLRTQVVQNREFAAAEYEMTEEDRYLHIRTKEVQFCVDKTSAEVRYVVLQNGEKVTDFKAGRLPGTARTLDNVNGAIRLEKGITSRSGEIGDFIFLKN